MLRWNHRDGAVAGLPRDAHWSWGLGVIVVVPSLDLVVARAGKSWKRVEGGVHYDPLKPFLEPIAAAISSRPRAASPVVRSWAIQRIEWAPTNTIVRKARGSDNWPMT